MKDHEEFEKLRIELHEDIICINKKIKYAKDLKKIRKATMQNMIEGPPVTCLQMSGDSLILKKGKESQSEIKNYHSDPENYKNNDDTE
jgi:hypothetical protein